MFLATNVLTTKNSELMLLRSRAFDKERKLISINWFSHYILSSFFLDCLTSNQFYVFLVIQSCIN